MVQPHLSAVDEDIPFYDEPIVKVENVDLSYEQSCSPGSDHSSSDLSQSLEYGDADMDIAKNKKEVIDACQLLAIPTGN